MQYYSSKLLEVSINQNNYYFKLGQGNVVVLAGGVRKAYVRQAVSHECLFMANDGLLSFMGMKMFEAQCSRRYSPPFSS